ncbi:unnamed protein product [Mycena citricolor]|uniref:Uncharacterized protein n=1 Tax=Mycena citricolor TaxID=2018698 RepID=A0AAD2GVA9_9AGAR|nr:unnamed protein product [Mycena citricolor]
MTTPEVSGKEKGRVIDPDTNTIRITTSGKIKGWVNHALVFFENHESTPLVLHTLPSAPKSVTTDEVPTGTAKSIPERNASKLPVPTSTVPRLLTVVEIIKREYLKNLEAKSSALLLGLHQYNEIGVLAGPEEEGELVEEADARRSREIIAVLEGKNHVQDKPRIPYMRITLCREKLPHLELAATYQPPSVRKISKSAKARARKREKKAEQDGVADQSPRRFCELGELKARERWLAGQCCFLVARRYALRLRYSPDWIPSCKLENRDICPPHLEDYACCDTSKVLDVVRIKDGVKVVLKRMNTREPELLMHKTFGQELLKQEPGETN